MRTYGRITNPDGTKRWVEVTSNDEQGDSLVWVTTVIQNCKLILGESPFFANYGIPAEQAILQQIFPDFYVMQMQQRFAQYFASLIIVKIPGIVTPTYRINIITEYGTRIEVEIPT
jgi:hypothetical protein